MISKRVQNLQEMPEYSVKHRTSVTVKPIVKDLLVGEAKRLSYELDEFVSTQDVLEDILLTHLKLLSQESIREKLESLKP